MFHLQDEITKRLMTYLQKYILGRSFDKKRKFEEVPHIFWNSYNIDVWRLHENFNYFIGSKIKAFIDHIPKIDEFLEKNHYNKPEGQHC